MENKVAIYPEVEIVREVATRNNKTKLVRTDLKGKDNYYEDNNIVFYTASQIKTLIDGTENLFHRMAMLLLYETAARIEEARALRFSDVDTATGRIKVITLKQRKKNKIYRYLKISDKLTAAILKHRIAAKLSDSDFILAKEPGADAIDRKSITYAIKYNTGILLGKEELYKAHPHGLRHTRAVHLLDSGMNIMLLKNFLGHANIVNTLIYLKYSNKDMAEAIDRANRPI